MRTKKTPSGLVMQPAIDRPTTPPFSVEQLLALDTMEPLLPALPPANGTLDEIDSDIVEETVIDPITLVDTTHFRRTIRLEKQAGRRLDAAKSEVTMIGIMDGSLNTDRRKRGWTLAFAVDGEPDERFVAVGTPQDGWTYTVDVVAECRPKTANRGIPMQFENILSALDAKAKLPANRWRVASVDGKPYVAGEVNGEEVDPNEELGYAPFDLPEEAEWLKEFNHLYGLDDYIAIIRSTLELAVMSEWRDRVNIALIGPPACGKTDLCKAVRRAVGDESVLEFDATSTSMAGAQEQLGQMEEMPRIMVLEEIEKAPESALPWLLSVLDLRGEVRKKTARSEINKSVHMVGICTVNDESKFNAVASGALASRFSMPLYFNRPEREILWKILEREVLKINGSIEWIEPAIDFAEELNKASGGTLYIDPRKLIAICLTGRERLLTGEFQDMYRRTMRRTVKP